jgi:hypothetical protein
MTNRHGEPLSPESLRMLDYLESRARALGPAEILGRVRAAMRELDAALSGVDETAARARPIPGEWSIAQVADHMGQTQIRAAAEIDHLLAGRRPPAPPVYEALTSGAAAWAPWPQLLDDLRSANEALAAGLAVAPPDRPAGDAGPAVRTILVANRALPGGGTGPEIFAVDLDWKAYALVQRLHLLDHRTQVRKLRAALDGR